MPVSQILFEIFSSAPGPQILIVHYFANDGLAVQVFVYIVGHVAGFAFNIDPILCIQVAIVVHFINVCVDIGARIAMMLLLMVVAITVAISHTICIDICINICICMYVDVDIQVTYTTNIFIAIIIMVSVSYICTSVTNAASLFCISNSIGFIHICISGFGLLSLGVAVVMINGGTAFEFIQFMQITMVLLYIDDALLVYGLIVDGTPDLYVLFRCAEIKCQFQHLRVGWGWGWLGAAQRVDIGAGWEVVLLRLYVLEYVYVDTVVRFINLIDSVSFGRAVMDQVVVLGS